MRNPWVAADVVLPPRVPGCDLVVGAIVVRGGRVFVQRRTPQRTLFPGCWDLVGGHVGDGEAPFAALAREVEEETGWALTRILALVYTGLWTGDDGRDRQELDFVVTVAGDLDNPRLEAGKHDAWRWVGPGDLAVLDESRRDGDVLVRKAVTAALRWCYSSW